MAKLTKKQKEISVKYDLDRAYPVLEGMEVVKNITYTKFDASVDLAVNLGVNPQKADQLVRGAVLLPHGTGKKMKILVLCSSDKEKEAMDAGADYVGLDDYIKKIEQGWVDVDVVLTIPSVMAKVGKLGKILGPRGLMPNPRNNTVTNDLGQAIKDIKSGKIDFKVEKFGIIHSSIGRVSFSAEQLRDNALELINNLVKLKPSSAKGVYVKGISVSSTMSRSVMLVKESILGLY